MVRCARFALLTLLLTTVSAWAQVPILEPLVSSLDQPVFLTYAHDGSNRKFIVEQPGRILVLQPGSTSPTVFLDIRSRVLSGGERGLLGLTFHPQYGVNGRFFVNYTRQTDGATVVAEYHVSGSNPNAADSSSETVLLLIAQPFPNHNGGMIEFGPDNYLYIGMGDGGSANDPGDRAQNVNDLLGKMLRIDVDQPSSPTVPYSSPATNPFFGAIAGRDEIYATGLRNPWRFSFDRFNGQLYAGDVGQGSREEVDIIVRGGNYGWRVLEGTRCTNLGPVSCSVLPAIPPIAEYLTGQNGRCAVTGGYAYRGSRGSFPFGAYIFGDFCSGEIFMFQGGIMSVLLDTTLNISSFGEDESGELYVVNIGGSISRLAVTSPPVTQRNYAMPSRAGSFLVANGSGTTSITTGYARIEADPGDALPSALAIFVYRQNGVVISELTIPASPLVQTGRFAALVSGVNTTAVAIANPNSFSVNINFNFTNESGLDFGHGTTSIPSNGQIAAFLNQAPFNGSGTIDGTFTFRASGNVSVAAIRGVTNARSDFLMSVLPIAPINGTILTDTIFPHWAHGSGFSEEFILVNPSDVLVTGNINLLDTSGALVQSLGYSIPPRSSRRLSPTTSSVLRVGSARIVATGGPLPSGGELIRLTTSAGIVSETVIPAMEPGFNFRGYGEFSMSARTGFAIANATSGNTVATVELRNLDGSLRGRGDIDLSPSGHRALFLDEVPDIDASTPFQGTFLVTSTAQIAVTALRTRINERGDFLMNATFPENLANTVSGTVLFFPHLALGGGFDMQFVLINPQATTDSGTLSFVAPNGNALPLSIP